MPGGELLRGWPEGRRGLVAHRPGVVARFEAGELERRFAWASVSKVALALATLRLVDEGLFRLDDVVTAEGATLRALLAHAGGIGLDDPSPIAPAETRRIYSNAGYELVGGFLERWTGDDVAAVLAEQVFGPLEMTDTRLEGSPAWGVVGPVADLDLLLGELMAPRLLSVELAEAMRTVQWPELAGVVPGVGRFDPCPWGLGVEIKGSKRPHWTPASMGPSSFGHFGRSGGFLIIEPAIGFGAALLGDLDFGPWALASWPPLLGELASTT